MDRPAAEAVGTAVRWKLAQLAGVKIVFVIRILILARLLVPDDFGLLAVALIPIGLALSLSDLGMLPALIQHREPDDRHYDTAWTLEILRATAVAGIVMLTAPFVAQFAGEVRATPIIRVLALQPILQAAASIKIAQLNRRLDFRALAFVTLSEALVNAGVSIALAPSLGVWALVAGGLSGTTAHLAASYAVAPHRPRLKFDRASTIALIRFGRWIFVSGVLVVIGSAALRIAISRRLGAAELGIYFMAGRLTFMIADAASEVAGSVAFPVYARLQSDTREVIRAFQAVLTALLALLLPVFGILLALAPSLVQEVLGPSWAGTTPVIRVLGVVCLLGVLGDVAVPILKGMGRPSGIAALEAAQSLLLLALAWELTGRYGTVGAACAWLPAIVASMVLSVVLLRQLLHRPFAGLGSPIVMIAVASAAGAGTAWGIDALVPGLRGLLLSVLVGGGVSGVVLWGGDRSLALGLSEAVMTVFPQLRAVLPVRNHER